MLDICISNTASLRMALAEIDKSGCGIAIIVDSEGKFVRTITDGDLRRAILAGSDLESSVSALPSITSITVPVGTTRMDALSIMDAKNVDHLPVIAQDGRVAELFDRKTISKRIHLSSPHIGDYEKEYVDEAFRSNWIAPIGPNVDAFEEEMCALIGIKAAAAVSSGTAAIHLAMRLLGVEQGDRVFCSSLTFIASASPIIYQGAEPVFIDSEPETWNMSPAALERALEDARAEKKLPKAIVVVNLYGQSADMDPLIALADHYGVPIIEDAAESLGATYKGRASGTFGRLGVFSFNGNKIITTSGGGMLVSDDEDLIIRARFLATQAREPAAHYQHEEIGYNYRMSNILAGVGRGQLRVLGQRVEARRALFKTYTERLGGIEGLSWMPEPEWSYTNRWLSVCVMDEEVTKLDHRTLQNRLFADGIEARPVWKPLHLQPVFEGARYYSHSNESVADRLYASGLCLPSGSNLTDEDTARIIDKISTLLE